MSTPREGQLELWYLRLGEGRVDPQLLEKRPHTGGDPFPAKYTLPDGEVLLAVSTQQFHDGDRWLWRISFVAP